jgi:cation transport ATPase
VVSFVPENELLKLSSSVEVNSEHIIAQAIVEHTREKRIDIPQASGFKAIPGKGAYGVVEGREVFMGGPNLLNELNIGQMIRRFT